MKKLLIIVLFLCCLFPLLPWRSMVTVSAKQGKDTLSHLANDLSRKPDDPPYLTFYYRFKTFCFSADVQRKDPIVFLGDSITDEGEWSTLFPALPVKNRGIGGDTTLGVMNRLNQVVAMKPSKIFIMIGTNDLCYGRPIKDIVANYRLILERFKSALPTTTIYVQSVLPFNDTLFPSSGLRTNANIRQLNIQIKQVAKEYNCQYIDLTSAFSGNDNRLPVAYTSDGLHLSTTGYSAWHNQIAEFVTLTPN